MAGTVTVEPDVILASHSYAAPLKKDAEAVLGGMTGRSRDRSGIEGMRVLVVEDEIDSREMLEQILGMHGCIVRSAASAEHARRLLESFLPDVIVSDIGMPHEDGFELMRSIRAMAPGKGGHIPSIALTAFTSREDQQRAYDAGFQIHLGKPVQFHVLVEALISLRS